MEYVGLIEPHILARALYAYMALEVMPAFLHLLVTVAIHSPFPT